jgi:rhodanese-related sulfurtransferase
MDTVDTTLPSLSPDQLNARLGRADAPLVLDVRRAQHYAQDEHFVPGAIRCTPEEVAAFAAREPQREVVAYCVFGHNVCQDAVRTLREAGWDASYLQGGILGGKPGEDSESDIARWRAEPVLRARKRPDLGVNGEQPSRWITRERPKIDRIACPWLIRRFIDPRAEFFYVPESQVFEEADRLQAVPYDIAGAPITHEWERCSFDALLSAFGLSTPALDALATIVRGADTSRMELAPQAAGLLAISLGLSRLHAQDDHAMLAAGMPVYDALYAWCREARGEEHFWKAHANVANA